jgi:signal transduction histidine kinase
MGEVLSLRQQVAELEAMLGENAVQDAHTALSVDGDWVERDRHLIAYEIHDGFVQDATGAMMRLETLLETDCLPKGRPRHEVQLSLQLIRKAVADARRLISGLRPPILDELGVAAAIKYLIDDQAAGGPPIDVRMDVQFARLEPLLEGTAYRIVQEAITNVRRHSSSDRAEVRLTQVGDRLHVEVRDWGIGFDPNSVQGKRFGLRGIRERARLLGGRAEIDSVPGKGTRVFVDLPLARAPREVATS